MFVINDSDQRIPIKVWLDNKNQIEESALQQAKNISNLPFAFKWVALMPDVHQGYGMPIGGILAAENVVVPNAVGVDIGCLDKETEFLTQNGWKKMNEYQNGDKVLQYNKENDTANFVEPINYIVKKCDNFIHFKNSKGLNQVLSDEHKMLIWKGFKKRGYNLDDMRADEVLDLGNRLDKGYYGIKTSFDIDNGEGINMTENEIKLDVMIAADGSIKFEREDEHQIYLHFKKYNKIERARKLLKLNKIHFKETLGKNGTTHIYFFINKKFNKDLSKYWMANKNQLKVLSEESKLWDGHCGYRSCFVSTNKGSADVIQFAFTATNKRAGICKINYKKKNWKPCYYVIPTKNNVIGLTNTISKIKSKDGKKYCFTVPSGYFVVRRNDKIFITGNCGMAFVETNLHESDFSEEGLKNFIDNLMREIPVGFKHHKEMQESNFVKNLYKKYQLEITPFDKEFAKAFYQMGTLGGGNHFLEVQRDEDDRICIMIHSGSRNFGYKIANYFNKIAKELNKKWFSSVPEKHDLDFLPVDTKEGQEYIKWMNVALEFAMENRQKMLEVIKNELKNLFPDVEFKNEINAHHNYASIENHFNRNVWVHRKGAIRVREGEYGIIPGAMGSYSYIVKGKGNSESFHSCSHGAGRVMSRKKAKENISVEKTINDLKDSGVVLGKQKKQDISEESRFAYKDIDDVINKQLDLIEPVKKLKTLAVIKG